MVKTISAFGINLLSGLSGLPLGSRGWRALSHRGMAGMAILRRGRDGDGLPRGRRQGRLLREHRLLRCGQRREPVDRPRRPEEERCGLTAMLSGHLIMRRRPRLKERSERAFCER